MPALLSACNQAAQSAPPSAAAFHPDASIQEVMAHIVDPAADAIWASVKSETTAQGLKEYQPNTESEWLEVRHHTISLAEAANLLLVPGRPVSHTKQLEDAHVPGILTVEQVRSKIDQDPAKFAAAARELQLAAQEATAAVDGKNAARLMAAGEKIDAACERCHRTYWYPNTEQPKWPAPLKPDAKP
ncbi:cytochrome c [Pseudoduganella sp. CY13W]|uniref:Cytochrome c n=2 Tax=Duganella qianjiadongensis TaxID=2692176 RepID=A0ABW9VK05_9BURK|nr:cytochrome c [Duganella qianjiadongensis]